MNEFTELTPKPTRIEIVFQESDVSKYPCGKSSYGEVVTGKLVIDNPFVVSYHTYGYGIIHYYVEWFSESVRPLQKWNMTFDNSQVKSIKFINPS